MPLLYNYPIMNQLKKQTNLIIILFYCKNPANKQSVIITIEVEVLINQINHRSL